jgi:spermidine/putrescine-binding protein
MTQGFFGYTIGKKKRIMRVQQDADLLWQILVREIYVLMCHYKTKEELEKAFEKIKTTKSNKPKPTDIEKCKIFADFTLPSPLNDWISLLRYNQLSYINLLESGYILNETK